MYMNSNTKVTCDPGVIWQLTNTNFGIDKPVLGQRETVVTGLDVSGIGFDGQFPIQTRTLMTMGKGMGRLHCLKI
jgi:hypothetical protein